jgi:glyoxylase-like metal-dependent hydrolase (beta-lactamase superfamily II)
MTSVKPLGNGIYQIELVPVDQIYNATAYLIRGKLKTVLIETGASRSNGAIREAMAELGLSPEDLDAVIVTHIHLDHSGGAGLLLEQCPNATLYVHEKGAPHLADPEKLIAGSRAVYGDSFDHYFAPVVPVLEDRIHPLADNDTLDIGDGRVLQMLESPGHALHHMAVFDPESRGIFTGDAAGIYYHALERDYGVKVALPSTTPTQFDPDATRATLDRMLSLDPARLYYTHFGMAQPAKELLASTKNWLDLFAVECVAYYRKALSLDQLTDYLQRRVMERLTEMGVADDADCLEYMEIDNRINAQGLIAYMERLERKNEKAKR